MVIGQRRRYFVYIGGVLWCSDGVGLLFTDDLCWHEIQNPATHFQWNFFLAEKEGLKRRNMSHSYHLLIQ